MKRLSRVADVRSWVADRRAAGARIGLVPTMGALHRAHLELVHACRAKADAVVMSVFVNPLQFGPGEDFERYPRNLERDAALAAGAGVDLLFTPEVADLYPAGPPLTVDPGRLGTVLEGEMRPTHFRGVATVVTKLFNICAPDVAVFGQKDAQQVVVVRSLVREFLWPLEVLCVPTVRDDDGLALSSRNVYLDAAQRRTAPELESALAAAVREVEGGERDATALAGRLRDRLGGVPGGRVDYAAVVAAETLEPVTAIAGRILILIAVRFGATRLLDNACLEVTATGVRAALP
jgi:pantoate--beta-alanine ligase